MFSAAEPPVDRLQAAPVDSDQTVKLDTRLDSSLEGSQDATIASSVPWG